LDNALFISACFHTTLEKRERAAPSRKNHPPGNRGFGHNTCIGKITDDFIKKGRSYNERISEDKEKLNRTIQNMKTATAKAAVKSIQDLILLKSKGSIAVFFIGYFQKLKGVG
jgi:hypothetical protein